MAGFGYNILGFGSGGRSKPYNIRYLVIAGGGAGGKSTWRCRSGGYRTGARKSFR